MSTPIADLCDDLGDRARVARPGLRSFGGRRRFRGPAAPVRLHEDNSLVRELLSQPGEGRVLVVDGGGSRRCALVGDRLGALAVENGWAGIVVWGCVRDTAELANLELGILALDPCPRKSVKRGVGERDVRVEILGVQIGPRDSVVADEDGWIVVETEHLPEKER